MILERAIDEELKTSYLDYAMSVIVGRALPNVWDGLKPVQRRILFAMHNLGLVHNRPFQKSAKVVGEVLGKYHPHGDAAIYDALARMAQDFTMRYCLVDGQGNFGSIDGDSPAAMRYTEVRMEKISEMLLQDIDKETVEMVPNFDNTLKEPVVLPTRVPNLLINGSMGIAVGMATSIPPHNLSEVCDALTAILEHPDIEDSELLELIKGPDFPTGGIICNASGIRKAYLTGKGTIVIRAKTEIDEKNNKILVKEIPYLVNKSELVEQIAELSRSQVVDGIASVHDYSDREGICIEIKLKKNASPEIVLNQLYAHSDMQKTFGILNVAIVDNVPKLFTLRELLREFLSFRAQTVTKRTKYLLRKAIERLEIVNALITASEHIDEIVEMLKTSEDKIEAARKLEEAFKFSDRQITAILQMPLQSIIKLEKQKLGEESAELSKSIEEYNSILSDEKKLREVIKSEIEEVKSLFGDSRRTAIEETELDIADEDLIEPEQVVIMLTQKGYVKRVPLEEYRLQHRGGKGTISIQPSEDDLLKQAVVSNTKDTLLVFTEKGNVFWLKAYLVPEMTRYSSGRPIVNILSMPENERPSRIVAVSSLSDDDSFVFVTSSGVVKRISSLHFKKSRSTGKRVIKLKEGDRLIDVLVCSNNDQIFLASSNGYSVRFSVSQLRQMGRLATGVRGMRLRKDDSVVSATVCSGKFILTITEKGYGKMTPLEEYRLQKRGGKGITNIETTEKNGRVFSVFCVEGNEELVLIASNSKGIRIPVSQIRIIGRATQGVKLMDLEQSSQISAASVFVPETQNNHHQPTEEK